MVDTIFKSNEQEDGRLIQTKMFIWFAKPKTFDLQSPILRCNFNKYVIHSCKNSITIRFYSINMIKFVNVLFLLIIMVYGKIIEKEKNIKKWQIDNIMRISPFSCSLVPSCLFLSLLSCFLHCYCMGFGIPKSPSLGILKSPHEYELDLLLY